LRPEASSGTTCQLCRGGRRPPALCEIAAGATGWTSLSNPEHPYTPLPY